MRRVHLILPGLLVFGTGAGRDDEVLRNRTTVGVDLVHITSTGDSAVGGLLDEKLQAEVFNGTATSGTLLLNGRLRYSFESGLFDDTRVRDLRLHLDNPTWEADFGRIPVDGGFRLVDGTRILARAGDRWKIGGWLGSGVSPYTTLPSARFGGGPIAEFQSDKLRLDLLGEVLVGGQGLDKLSGVAALQYDPTRRVNLSSRLDLQYGGPNQPLSIADASVFLGVQAHDRVRFDLLYDGYSSYAYLWSEKQDPSVTRFAQNAVSIDPNLVFAADELDNSMYHLTGGGVRWRPTDWGLDLRATTRYRYHALPDRRYTRFTLHQGVIGLAGGKLDLAVQESYLYWGGRPGWQATLLAFAEPFGESGVALDGSVQYGVKALLDDLSVPGPYLYADGFVDWMAPNSQWMLSAGYGYSRALDLELWDQEHALIGRVTWNLRKKRREP